MVTTLTETLGRRFSAQFSDAESCRKFLAWSAAQTIIYNAKAEEFAYFRRFNQRYYGMTFCRELDENGNPQQTFVPMPLPDQKYAQFLDGDSVAWIRTEKVPSQVLRNGAVDFKRACQMHYADPVKFGYPKSRRIRGADRKLHLTREIFTITHLHGDKWRLTFGTKRMSGGSLIFKAHQNFEMPASVHVKLAGGRLTVSFSFETPITDRYPETRAEILGRLSMLTAEELQEQTVGIDRGCVKEAVVSTGGIYCISNKEKDRIRAKEIHRKRYQRVLARCQKGSKNSEKLKRRIARQFAYGNNVRENFAHQVSHTLVTDPNVSVLAFEDLKVKNMTKSPKAKPDGKGGYKRNGHAQKAGLNASILESAWGKLAQYTNYKAAKNSKVVVFVDPKNTSRECSVCHCTAEENRPSQAVFRCTNPQCRHQENADGNAAKVIRNRAVELILARSVAERKSKKVMRLKRPSINPMCVTAGEELPGCEQLPQLLPVEHPTERGLESVIPATQCDALKQEASHVNAR